MTRLAHTTTPRGDLDLVQREDGAIELRVNGVFVMDTREMTTEAALAEVALAEVADPRNVLIGGLGLGFTLHAVLGDVRVERVVVAEIEGPLVDWMRDGTIPHGPAYLADQRVRIDNLDVRLVVTETAEGACDLVLLDTDNGPDQLVHEFNAALYEQEFLADVRRILSDGGVLAVWSAHESDDLLERMRAGIGEARALSCAVDLHGRSEEYWLHVARKPR